MNLKGSNNVVTSTVGFFNTSVTCCTHDRGGRTNTGNCHFVPLGRLLA